MSIDISAIICTYNRVKYLSKAIQSLVGQTLDKSLYEIIIVDNGSIDDTKRIVLEEYSSVTNLHYLYEPILGLSQARNTGWQNARGDYVAYLDDDAIACPEWLKRIIKVFETVRPKPGCVGGKIHPVWEAPRPAWLADSLLGSLTIIDWSKVPIILSEKQWLGGANIAFPRSILKAMGGFAVELGRKGNKLLSMEEILLRNQLEKKGYCCYYDPEITVQHHIPSSRISKNWLIRRSFWQGVSHSVILINSELSSIPRRLKRAFAIILKFILSPKNISILLKKDSKPQEFKEKCYKLGRLGYIYGLLNFKDY